MSAFDFIKLSLPTIREFLDKYAIELKETVYPDTYLIKFTSVTDVNDPVICRLKGLIFNHAKGTIVSMTYPVAIEVNSSTDLKSVSEGTYDVQQALDGTLLRYSWFNDEKKWQLSTINKENASEAFWLSNESFAQQFESIDDIKLDVDSFDKKHVHLFVMCHPHNINVVAHEKAHVYHVATYDRELQLEIEHDLCIPKPNKLPLKVEQLRQLAAEAADKPVKSAGYMVVHKRSDGVIYRYRFEAANYTAAKKLRGNDNNIDYLLLRLWQNSQLTEFHTYYPMYVKRWNDLYERFTELTRKLYREYGLKHKQHRFVHVHPRHAGFIIELHTKLFLEQLRPQGQTVNLPTIGAYLTKQPTAKLLYLLNYIYDTVTAVTTTIDA